MYILTWSFLLMVPLLLSIINNNQKYTDSEVVVEVNRNLNETIFYIVYLSTFDPNLLKSTNTE
jgi:hypothetical protein